MTTTPAVDDFAYIRERVAELEGDKRPAEVPKAWPSYAGVEQPTEPSGEIWGHYTAPDYDPA